MSATYKTVLWNRQKKRYDFIMLIGIIAYLVLFIGLTLTFFPAITEETLIIRATGTLAILMLHVILIIGPLCRLDKRFLPILYNRRHLGVTMFIFGAIHGIFSTLNFHSLGNENPILSIFTANQQYDSLVNFPFQTLGFFALIILFLMAATSHDFWLKNLSPAVWKGLHMMVYVAYAFLILHVMLGVVQLEKSIGIVVILGIGMLLVISLHLIAGWKQRNIGQLEKVVTSEGFVKVCPIHDIPENRAKLVNIDTESIAIFKYEGKLSAINNFCKHQNGPLSEGKFVDGCITCPWHGYQYLAHNGQSPPPFTEKVATYHVRLINDEIWVNPKPEPEGTHIEPVVI